MTTGQLAATIRRQLGGEAGRNALDELLARLAQAEADRDRHLGAANSLQSYIDGLSTGAEA